NATKPNLCVIDPNTGVGNPTPAYTYGLFMAEVEVDVATGKTTILSYTAVTDVGVIGNPVSVDGQAYGGLSHCMGFALSEDYDDVKKHNNIAGAGIPTIKDIPDDFHLIHIENPRDTNPYGSSGASEAFQSSGHMAVINGIYHACGVRIYELPARPAKVKDGLERLARGEEILPPKKYFLGSDFEEEMENIKNNPV
ncbi:MAG: molybdopterin cofactor-binding domain-containing protein, partial [Anaerovoracaceae bacterium]